MLVTVRVPVPLFVMFIMALDVCPTGTLPKVKLPATPIIRVTVGAGADVGAPGELLPPHPDRTTTANSETLNLMVVI